MIKQTEPVIGHDRHIAVVAELLYLANLLLLPGIAFLALLLLRHRYANPRRWPLSRCHLRQAVAASLWAVVALLVVNGTIVFIGGLRNPYTWVWVGVYLASVHSLFVLLGVFGLAKAMAGLSYHFPVVGVACDD